MHVNINETRNNPTIIYFNNKTAFLGKVGGNGNNTSVGNGNIGGNKLSALIHRTAGQQQIHTFFLSFHWVFHLLINH